jgi:peptide methionine sulfoxide reductase msrA/msrB
MRNTLIAGIAIGAVIGLMAAAKLVSRPPDSLSSKTSGKETEMVDSAKGKSPDEGKQETAKTEDEWRHCLSPEAYHVLREQGTEMPFTGKYYKSAETGVFHCAACGSPLFTSDTKYDSGTGWPSFWQPVSPEAVSTRTDNSLGRARTEVLCGKCGSHLGHVFEDGPKPTGLRYCINSVSLDLQQTEVGDASKTATAAATAKQTAVATFAAGCFWGVEAKFREVKGILDATVGYTGGRTEKPTYEQVCTDKTGHAEAVRVEYDPTVVTYDQLLEVFWQLHDPTTLNRQGPDAGTQYRSVIFYHTEDQRKAALASKERLAKSGKYGGRPIVTEIVPAAEFTGAEEYHQRYFEKHGGACGL